ncbi:hypothetical protein [Cytobacillus horneckiae]|uniref:hypothetical protein n=1 Tax=Cytobacillus horneckiae TaxID=549687 RepID=UPI000AFAAF82
MEDLQNNPIANSTNALKNNQAFVNIVDPSVEGGPAYSRIEFVKALQEHLGKE